MRCFVLFALLASGCAPNPCTAAGATLVPGAIEHLEIMLPARVVLATAQSGIAWYPLNEDGTLGPAVAALPEALAGRADEDFIHLSVENAEGFRLVTSRSATYVGEGIETRVVPWTRATPSMPEAFSIERVWRVGGLLYAVWLAADASRAEMPWIAGLARIEDDDTVTALGAAFCEGAAPTTPEGARIFGGFDDAPMAFWIECPMGQRLLQIDPTGAVVTSMIFNSEVPPLFHWLKQASGVWSGLHGGTWYQFLPKERDPESRTVDVVPASGAAWSTTQALEDGGDVWIAGASASEIVLRRWTEAAGRMDEFRSQQTVYYCRTNEP